MTTDPITEEIRRIRHELAAPFNNNLELILADLRMREALDGRKYVSFSPRRTPSGPPWHGRPRP